MSEETEQLTGKDYVAAHQGYQRRPSEPEPEPKTYSGDVVGLREAAKDIATQC